MLLYLSDRGCNEVCRDYFAHRGCEADVASDLPAAQSFLRFRTYETVVTDAASSEDGNVREIIGLARRHNPAVRAVVLTTVPEAGDDPTMTVLTKPLPLHELYAAAAAALG